MFSFKRKSRKSTVDGSPITIKVSPSLPELRSPDIPWPEDLVDVAAIRQTPPPDHPYQGAVKTSFSSPDRAPIAFHRPFRANISTNGTDDSTITNEHLSPINEPISSQYMSHPPSAFDAWRTASLSAGPAQPRQSHSRKRLPATFNLMVVGGRSTGKTALLHLLLETADISPTASDEQRLALMRFLRHGHRRTQAIETTCVEICESRYDRVLLTVIDTPGLDFSEGRELRLERQVTNITKYIEAQYADTMNEESKVVRQSKGDQHVHLCIYMIDPASIMTPSARRALISFPTKIRSETSLSRQPSSIQEVPNSDHADNGDERGGGDEAKGVEGQSGNALTMSPADIHVLRRLMGRVNILPVIAQADSLTDDKLHDVKQAVRAGFQEAGLDFGVFDESKRQARMTNGQKTSTRGHGRVNGEGSEGVNGHGSKHAEEEDATNDTGTSTGEADTSVHHDGSFEDDDRPSRPVVKLRGNNRTSRSRSRSRRDLSALVQDDTEPSLPDASDMESLANARFSAHTVGKVQLNTLLPFALIAPEPSYKSRAKEARPASMTSSRYSTASATGTVNGVSPTPGTGTTTPTTSTPERSLSKRISLSNFRPGWLPNSSSAHIKAIQKSASMSHVPPSDLRGMFVRKFRWGTIDVLDPDHCDFAAFRTTVLSTHLKVLKTHTREVLYEKFRTEKLLVKRATRNIGPEATKRLLEDLGL